MTTSETDAEQRLVAGRYRLLSPLGKGGMGVVWAAEDELLQRSVAVKEVRFPPTVSDDEREMLRERTMREARTAARLDHPCAVRVFDVCEDDEQPFIVMELLNGRTLSDVVRDDGPLSPAEAATIGLCLLDALDAAHAAGIVHRDVKPGNVVVGSDGRVTLTDFGIASTAGDPSITTTGLLLGSPAYISPERARGGSPQPPSDLWSLGATLYTTVEGHPPFDKGDAFATLAGVVTEPPEPCERAGTLLSAALERLLEKDPSSRPSPSELRTLLEEVRDDPDSQVASPRPVRTDRNTTGGHTVALTPTKERPSASRRGRALALVALSVAVFLVSATISAILTAR